MGSIVLAQAEAAGPSHSLFELVMKGGPMMIPIGICSLVAFAIVIERLASLRRGRIMPGSLVSGLRSSLDRAREAPRAAIDLCKASNSPFARICMAGLTRLGQSPEMIEKRVAEAGEHEVFKLRKHLRSLAVIASVAPLLGLTGTIFGMITAFQTVAFSGEALGKTEQLAGGIYEAMVTTAAGLLVAIPSIIFYNLIASRIDRLVAEMDRGIIEFIEGLMSGGPARGEATPGGEALGRPKGGNDRMIARAISGDGAALVGGA